MYNGIIINEKTVVIDPLKTNKRIQLSDRIGELSMLLTKEELKFVRDINGWKNFLWLYYRGYLKKGTAGTRLFMYAFEGNKVLITYKKGKDARLLSLGTDPAISQSTPLIKEICNPELFPLQFMEVVDNKGKGMKIYLPLFQPHNIIKGSSNDWSIPLVNLK